ncbi:uncharacterized protein [Rutidosis leptorrhynchoides]|uniref:uncharacterized protein n=1 Tax=Rutidosis leptorrhynchoides TaxID=125765 RepID=UPI003A9A34AF
MPVAFAMVDKESNESWSWFLHLFRTQVASRNPKELCVISDSHQGILNAQLQQPFQGPSIEEIMLDSQDIDPKMWSLFRDKDHHRWGNLTTNIAKSLNNVLRYARVMPIKAYIEYNFDYTRIHFIEQYDYAREWNAPLARKYWKLYQFRETRATSHMVTVYNVEHGVYNIHTIEERIGDRGNEFIVQIVTGNYSCGRWQNQRIRCSHVIASCGHRDEDPKTLMSGMFRTKRWENQYKGKFSPLRDVIYWGHSNTVIRADPVKLITSQIDNT